MPTGEQDVLHCPGGREAASPRGVPGEREHFRIQVAGERVRVPARAAFSIEHERGEDEEEIEFQLTWSLDDVDGGPGR
ncbi:MAG: hypothetical protein ACXWDL_12630 [Nocardioides sp.]